MHTVVHVTHEAIQKIGGIGAVLQGLLTSRTYLQAAPRNILVGPFWQTDATGDARLGPGGEVLYSSLDHLYRSPLQSRFREIEQKFGVGIIYGRRKFTDKDTGVTSQPEVLLIDVSRFDPEQIGRFKFEMWEQFGIESSRYDHIHDFEQWMRLAPPAIEALHAIGVGTPLQPACILSHEYMGMPTALAAILEEQRGGTFRTIFYAHEVAPIRRIVEAHPGHDTMFYNVMRQAVASGHYIDEVFGDQSDFYKTPLVKAAKHCDGIFAVGDFVLKELKFLGPEFLHVNSQLAYNGVPHFPVDVDARTRSRNLLRKYCNNLLRFEPDYVFSHVTRLVPSKGLWRDLRVLEHLEPMLRARDETAVLFVLSTEVPGRRSHDVMRMERDYKWPVAHREGPPDLSGGEAAFYQGVQEFNACSRNIKVVFINQFGFEQHLCGKRMPAEMEFNDLRKGSDVEFGQSIYEPFGIAQVEPISFGGICVFSNVCGCAGFVHKAAGEKPTDNVIIADYTDIAEHTLRPEQMMSIGQPQRDAVEHKVAQQVAEKILERLPRTPADFAPYIERGQALANRMSWEVVARDYVIPGIDRAMKANRIRQIA